MDCSSTYDNKLLKREPQNAANGLQEDEFCATERETAPLISRRRLAFSRHPVTAKKTALLQMQIKQETNLGTNSNNSETKSSTQEGTGIAGGSKASSRMWTLQEQTVFYEALKLHGKDFEAVSKFMLKKKITKDKEQVRNYYLNTFKVWKSKARIEDSDWPNVPRDARELFVLLNGCEWRKRLNGMSFDESGKRFRQLIMEGVVSFKPKRKNIVTIKTPFCPSLLKYFPYSKKNCEIPVHLTVRLKPLRIQDREFVISFEQNPFVLLQINVNDKISSLFQFLSKKWSYNIQGMGNQMDRPSSDDAKILLFADENSQIIHNVHVDEEETSPVLSLKKLNKDFETNELAETDNPTTSATAGKLANEIKLSASSMKEVFEINEDKIRAGLTEDGVGNASMLQLFYLLGMKRELSFNYAISDSMSKFQSWQIFKSLVARDYDELMAKTTTNLPANNPEIQPTSSANKICEQRCQPVLEQCQPFRKTPPSRQTAHKDVGIVERENLQFINQLKAHSTIPQQRRPKRQIKLVPDSKHQNAMGKRIFIHDGVMVNLAGPGNSVAYVVQGEQRAIVPIVQQQNASQICQQQQFVRNATDFSILTNPLDQVPMSSHRTIQLVPTTSVLPIHQPTTPDVNGELSIDSTATSISQFHPIVLDNSPNKSLPEDVRTACEQMLKENSVDYCRQFEQLANMHQDASASPIKNSNQK